MSEVAWPSLCGIHPQRCSRCRSAWRGSAARQAWAGRAAGAASPVMNRMTVNETNIYIQHEKKDDKCVCVKKKTKNLILTETVELGVLVPYPEEGREAKDQRRPSVLSQNNTHTQNTTITTQSPTFNS